VIPYPEGTRWAVEHVDQSRTPEGGTITKRVRLRIRDGAETDTARRPAAMACLWTMRNRDDRATYVLVRIPPPKPRRTVEERKRENEVNADLAQRWAELTERLGGILDERSTVLGVMGRIEERITEGLEDKMVTARRLAEEDMKRGVEKAVRERTAAIENQYARRFFSSDVSNSSYRSFGIWLSDLRDGKVTV
jgi:hypothetical protein